MNNKSTIEICEEIQMNITLFYQEKGKKEPFILLHGNGEDNSYFKHQIDYFSNRYRVIALTHEVTVNHQEVRNLLRLSSFPMTYTILW